MYGKDSLNDFRCNLVSFLGNGLSWRLSVLVVHGIGLIVILSPPRHKGIKRSEGNSVDPRGSYVRQRQPQRFSMQPCQLPWQWALLAS